MLGPAELREMDEALAEERSSGCRAEKTSPYIMPHTAFGVAVTRAAASNMKFSPMAFGFKR